MQHSLPLVRLIICLALSGASLGVFGQGAAGNDALMLLLDQNQNLQAEVQALRALVEEQGYEIRRLQRESLDRYTDTDSRLRNLEQAIASGSVGALTNDTGGTATSPGPTAVAPDIAETPAVGGVSSSTAPADTAAVPPGLPTRGLVTDSVAGNGAASGAQQVRRAVPPRSAASRPGLEPAVLTEQQLYQMAYDSAINSQFERAIAEFDQYLGIYPQGRFTTNAHYWKGQSYLYLSRYDEAIAEYELILNEYPDDAKVPDAMYGQAVALEGLGDTQRARRLLQQIMRNYPNTGVANLADTRLRSLN